MKENIANDKWTAINPFGFCVDVNASNWDEAENEADRLGLSRLGKVVAEYGVNDEK